MKNRWLIPLLAVAAAAVLAYASYHFGFWSTNFLHVMASPRLQGAPRQDNASPAVPGTQRVRAEARVVPVRNVALSVPLDGIVQEVLVEEGDHVTAGQLLVKLKDSRQRVLVTQAQAEVHRARAALALVEAGFKPEEIAVAEAALAAAQANYDKLANGQVPGLIAEAEAALVQAQADYRLLTSSADPQAIIEATANLDLAQAQLDQARAAYNKVRGSPDIGMLPESVAMQEATANYNAARARLDLLQGGATVDQVASAAATVRQAQAKLDTLNASQPGELAEAEALVRQAEAALDLAKVGPRAEEIAVAQGDVDIAVAQLQDALVALAETELRAPFDGVVTALDVDSGERIAPDLPVIQLADLSDWRIETLDLTELDVANIASGDPVTVTFDALPSLILTGKVIHVRLVGENSNVAPAPGSVPREDAALSEHITGDIVYRVVIEPETHDERLLWNMTALVDFGARPENVR